MEDAPYLGGAKKWTNTEITTEQNPLLMGKSTINGH